MNKKYDNNNIIIASRAYFLQRSPCSSPLVSVPPIVPAFKADFVMPTRRSERYGASMTDEDSMQKAMRRKAERNLDYSGIISPSKSKSFFIFFNSNDFL
jgi:hypothetical protein